jgi:hypothetical protein
MCIIPCSIHVTYFVICLNQKVQEGPFAMKSLALQAGPFAGKSLALQAGPFAGEFVAKHDILL